MRKIILKCCIFVILCVSCLVVKESYAASSTGHSEFESITIPNGSYCSLLVDMSSSEKKNAINNVKWKFFGWSTYNTYTREPVFYVGKTIFSRANRTNEIIEFDYNMKVGRTITNSVSISGGLSAKVSGKIKALSLGVDFKADADWEKVVKQTEEEKTSFKVKIKPRTRVSLYIKGMAEVTNGGSKYFVFGVPVKKGNFEFIDTLTEFYELYEERY